MAGKPAVYACERFVCKAPVTDPRWTDSHRPVADSPPQGHSRSLTTRYRGSSACVCRLLPTSSMIPRWVCLMIEGQEGVTWDDWVRLAGLCERHGLEGLFRSDHYTAIIRERADAHDAWATLAGLAAVTERIRLGTLVSPATFRHPSVLARMAVTVDHISRGRVEVGMGSGWYEREHLEHGFPFLDQRQRFALFEEQVEAVVRSWVEDEFDHEGPAYTLHGQTALPRPLQKPHPPLILGGWGKPRFAALAARYADEVNTLGAPNDELRERKARLDRACEDAGRDPATLTFSVMTACFLGADRAEALARLEAFVDVRGEGDAETLLEQRADRWLAGTVEEVAARIEELRALGVSRVFLQHLNHGDDDDGRPDRRPAGSGRHVASRHDDHRADGCGGCRMGSLRPLRRR